MVRRGGARRRDWSHTGVRAAGHRRFTRPRARLAGRGPARGHYRRSSSGERSVPRDGQRAGWVVPAERDDTRSVSGRRRAAGLQEVHAPRRAHRGRQDGPGRSHARGRRPRRNRRRHVRGAAHRHHVEGNRRPHQRAGVHRHAVVQPELRRLSRHAAGCRGDDLGHHVRRRLDQRGGTERPQRELHDGRVEQQRHLQRRQRRCAGTRARGGGAGVPVAHQPVRRRVRPRLRRHREFGVEARDEPRITAARFCSTRTRNWRRTSTSPGAKGSTRHRRSSSSGAGRSAVRLSATRRTTSSASSACCSTAA